MRVLVGISGGLDSAYAALKLQRQGHSVEGAVLVMHDFTEVDAAKSVADEIGIKLHVIDCREAFGAVIDNFVNEYCSARTPNPCIICNPLVKFRCLYDFAVRHGFDRIATGHYASVETLEVDGKTRYTLSRAKDSKKDQTYMLYRLPQEILSALLLPLACDEKSDVRRIAAEESLSVADRKDSQEICFIPDGDYATYIENIKGRFPDGSFVDPDGREIGKHKGIIRYTIGQRKGLGVSAGQRVFVTDIDPVNNTVTLSPEGLSTDKVRVSDIVFSGMNEPKDGEERRVQVKLRYAAMAQNATAVFDGKGGAELLLDAPQRAVTPGQSAVMYDGDILLCGGFII